MGDMKTLTAEEFQRAFQQHLRGEKPTGKKWRPTWKDEGNGATPLDARIATGLNVQSMIAAYVGSSSLQAGDSGLGVHTYRPAPVGMWSASPENVPAMYFETTKYAKRYLPRTMVDWNAPTSVPGSDRNAFKETRMGGVSISRYRRREGKLRVYGIRADGEGESCEMVAELDFAALYRLVRGTENPHWTLTQRIAKLAVDPEEYMRFPHPMPTTAKLSEIRLSSTLQRAGGESWINAAGNLVHEIDEFRRERADATGSAPATAKVQITEGTNARHQVILKIVNSGYREWYHESRVFPLIVV
jgi:hypothetical protein